jgi:hypothetical protein
MSRRLILLNTFLVAAIVAGIIRLRHNVITFSAEHQVSGIQPASEKSLPSVAAMQVPAANHEWNEIAIRNPFSFDRNDVNLVITPPAGQQAKRPKPILFGIMKVGTDQLAMLATGDGAGRSSRPVRIGEVFDGWTLLEIRDKSVTVRWEETKESLIMNDPTAQVARDYTKTSGATGSPQTSVTTVSTPAPSPAPTVQAPTAAAPTPTTSPSGRRQIVVQTPFGPKTMDDPSQP